MAELENINPEVYKKSDERKLTSDDLNNDVVDPIDEREVFGKVFLHFIYFSISSKFIFRSDKKYK